MCYYDVLMCVDWYRKVIATMSECCFFCQSHPKLKITPAHLALVLDNDAEYRRPTWSFSWLFLAMKQMINPSYVKSVVSITETQYLKVLVIRPIDTNCMGNITAMLWLCLYHMISTSMNKFLSCCWMLIWFCQYFHPASCPLLFKLRQCRIPYACSFIFSRSDCANSNSKT